MSRLLCSLPWVVALLLCSCASAPPRLLPPCYGAASIGAHLRITFAGSWPSVTRPVTDKVSDAFVILFVFYITVVVFAVIRVIGAVFLKDTLDAAQNDAEQLVFDRLRMKQQLIRKLEGIFHSIDEDSHGLITEERLNAIMSIPRVSAYFETMDLNVREGAALFHLIDNGDGEVTLEEFIDGIMRCKGPARAIDQVAMHADVRNLEAKVSKIWDHIQGGEHKVRHTRSERSEASQSAAA